MKKTALAQLISYKDEEVNNLRLDLVRLEQLVDEADQQVDQIHKEEEEILARIRTANKNTIAVDALMESRHFLEYLIQKGKNAELVLEHVTKECDLARRTLEQAYIAKKSFQAIADRKKQTEQVENHRRQLVLDDEMELLRSQRTKRAE